MVYNSAVPPHVQFNQRLTSRLTRLAQAGLLVYLALSQIASLRIGMADNGDFTRVMTWFTSRPATMKGNWQASGTPEYDQRYFKYYIPDWKLDFPLNGVFSSAVLLWLPGVLLNWLFYSQKVLSMMMVGLFPRLLSLVILWLAFRWINAIYPPAGLIAKKGSDPVEPAGGSWQTLVITLTLGIPLTLLLGSAAYMAYFNSFYQETGSFIFLFLFLAALIYTWRVDHVHPGAVLKEGRSFANSEPMAINEPLRPYLWPRYLALAALFGLLTSKVSNIYWVIPSVLLVVPWRKVLARPKAYLPLYIGVIATLALAVILMPSRPLNRQAQAYHSLFVGTLTFSDNPLARLQEIGVGQHMDCVGKDAYNSKGQTCFEQLKDQVSFAKTALVIWHEPAILLRMEQYVAKFIQRLKTGLGKYAASDPRATEQPKTLIDLWELLKGHLFPSGNAFWATIVAFTVLFVYRLRGHRHPGVVQEEGRSFGKTEQTADKEPLRPYQLESFERQLALIGLVATLACVVDMNVAVLGDGQREIVKHLFLANVLFDLAAIAAVNLVVVEWIEWRGRRRVAVVL